MNPFLGVAIFLLVCTVMGSIFYVLRKKFIDPYIRSKPGIKKESLRRSEQIEISHYKLLWSFSLPWGLAWLVLAIFLFSSLSHNYSILMRVAFLFNGIAYDLILVILTLPFFAFLRKRETHNKRKFNIIGCILGVYTVFWIVMIQKTVYGEISGRIANLLKAAKLPASILLLIFIALCVIAITLTIYFWGIWLRSILHIIRVNHIKVNYKCNIIYTKTRCD